MLFDRLQHILNIFLIGGTLAVSLFLSRCRSGHAELSNFSTVLSPEDNPFSEEKAELGRALFFDKRLSNNQTVSCATCHVPEFAFTDRKAVSEGVFGRLTERNAPTLLNAGFLPVVMFDAHLTSLEMQVIVPIQEHVEMDMKMGALIERLRNIEQYQQAARSIFNRDFDAFVLTRSIAAFQRTLISSNSRFDQYYYGKNKKALSKSEQRGWKLFSEELYCTKCHALPHFTTFEPENNGLYADFGADKGRFRIFHDSLDIGKFKVPTLRNIELTYPYMHNGSMRTLDEVIEHYAKGGAKHWNQNSIVQPFNITAQDKQDLKAFLHSLTDTSYLKRFQ